MSSPCPAMPTTSVANSSGTISDLIIRRKIVDRTLQVGRLESLTGRRAGRETGSRAGCPTTIEITIHCVMRDRDGVRARRRRRRGRSRSGLQRVIAITGVDGGRPSPRGAASSSGSRTRSTARDRCTSHQPNRSHARRGSPYITKTQSSRADDADRPHERHAERPRPIRLGVAQHDHADADERERRTAFRCSSGRTSRPRRR